MPNILALPDQPTVVDSWLGAVQSLSENHNRAYNLIYAAQSPDILTPTNRELIRTFNQFALQNDLHTTDSVANTIFPLDTYLHHKYNDYFEYYLNEIFPKVKKQWGTYFERMIRSKNDDGSYMKIGDAYLNPLQSLTEKIKRRVEGTGKTTTHYELPIDQHTFDIATYNAHHDGSYQIGGPCLSHLSFKIENGTSLRLTAFYRSHWYIARALGNLIGLARLQAYVARYAGIALGPLTIIASEAVLDLSASGRSASATRQMLQDCRNATPVV